ncbi:hypothetical protein GCM10007423_56360 [Dyadobacter endophyticus]|uniref:PH domain-containing protein n=1 Tax=Dyadobacter endophyticus TaxID=1749036 RepID=A0ABQ1Z9Z7_9BACT|nr:hypothetical protein [Dyadobacter endophyticus]GGH52195.1 hypothetical protein GCM10007423_56360 [Dyadobacter endophyticus]
METLIIFLGVFVPVGWGIWRLVRHTRDTIGTNSPVKVKRNYQIDAWAYFLTFDNAFLCLVLIAGSFFLVAAFTIPMAPDTGYPFVGRLLLFSLSCIMIGLSLYVLLIDANHWKYAEGVIIETFPEEHELELTFGDSRLRLKEGDITRVLITSNEGAKMPITYTTYYLANGDYFILPYKMPGAWVIQEYFKKIPTEFKRKRFPFIP